MATFLSDHGMSHAFAAARAALDANDLPAAIDAAEMALAETERAGWAPWRADAIVRFYPGPAVAGALLLTGHGQRVASRLESALVRPAANGDILLVSIPLAERTSAELLSELWLRVVGGDWRLPPVARGPKLTGGAGATERALRAIIGAFAARDRAKVTTALRAAAKLDGASGLMAGALRESARREGLAAAPRRARATADGG